MLLGADTTTWAGYAFTDSAVRRALPKHFEEGSIGVQHVIEDQLDAQEVDEIGRLDTGVLSLERSAQLDCTLQQLAMVLPVFLESRPSVRGELGLPLRPTTEPRPRLR
jgi:hypothetical protein